MAVIRRSAGVLVVFALAACVGCGSGNTRRAVSGTVTLHNQPLESGQIMFFYTDGRAGTVGGASVFNGRFDIPERQGVEPGTYLVRISAPVPGGERTPEQIAAGASTPAKESIPAKYNTESKLTVEVKAGEKNEFEFNLD